MNVSNGDAFGRRPRRGSLSSAPPMADDSDPTTSQKRPPAPVVKALLAANIAAFLLTLFFARSVEALLAPPTNVMMSLGANYAAATVREWRLETLVTACFLHFGVLHIAFNMVALRQLGPLVEATVGSGRFALLYVVTGVAGSATSAAWGAFMTTAAERGIVSASSELGQAWAGGMDRLSAGASGAICGILGAFLVVGIRTGGWRSPIARSMARSLGTVVLLGALLRFDNAAHIGGAGVGALVAATWIRRPESKRGLWLRLAVVLTIVGGAALRVAYVDATDPYATLRVPERAALLQAKARDGHCDEARRAGESLVRLSPTLAAAVQAELAPCREAGGR